MDMKVVVVGGTGFLGYYAVLEFLRRGHEVSSLAVPDIVLGDWYPREVQIDYTDVFKVPSEALVDTFRGYDALVYAVGPDDRVTPDAPAYQFFHDRLVVACTGVVRAARDAGIKRCVVLGSYFAYFDRVWPERSLADHHAYIKARIEQTESVMALGSPSFSVMVLELPYIFGNMPERLPLWKDILFERIRKMRVVFFPGGGSNMIAVEHVAEAIVGATEQGKHGSRYLIGDENLTWKELIRISLDAMGLKKRRIVTVPTFLMAPVGRWMKRKEKKKGKEAGLDMARFFKDIQSQHLFYDASDTAMELGYGRGGVKEAIEQSVRVCYPELT